MALPPVDRVVAAYLRAVDAAQPGLVEGLYLTGSVAMGDFHAGRGIARLGPSGGRASDIDFIAMTAGPPGSAAVDTLSISPGPI